MLASQLAPFRYYLNSLPSLCVLCQQVNQPLSNHVSPLANTLLAPVYEISCTFMFGPLPPCPIRMPYMIFLFNPIPHVH